MCDPCCSPCGTYCSPYRGGCGPCGPRGPCGSYSLCCTNLPAPACPRFNCYLCYTFCDCNKRNGLQDECRRSVCRGRRARKPRIIHCGSSCGPC